MGELMTTEQRVEWLHDFDNANYTARSVLASMGHTITALYTVGNDKLADRLGEYADILSESVEAMNKAVSRMIHEDLTEGQKQINETFRALLQTVVNSVEPRAGSSDAEREGRGL